MKKSPRVREPVQVYLSPEDRERLERLRARLDLSKSEVLRLGLSALEREATDADRHPLLQLSGILSAEEGPDVPYDPVIEHDRYFADYVDRQIAERWAEIDAARGARRRQKKRRG